MIPPLASLLDRMRASLRSSARQAALRLMLVATAIASGATGAAFVIFAAYHGLVHWLGPTFGALALGMILLAGAALAASLAVRRTPPAAVAAAVPTGATPFTADGLAGAVFALAFTLGRQMPRRSARSD